MLKFILFLLCLKSLHGGSISTCGQLNDEYKASSCCGEGETKLPAVLLPAPPTPDCDQAGPQAPRDLTPNAYSSDGDFIAEDKKFPPLMLEQVQKLRIKNIHFHEGAEHQSSEFTNDNGCLIQDKKTDPYEFTYCKGVEVGKTYEFHWVFSSSRTGSGLVDDEDDDDGAKLSDTLASAAGGGGALNPLLAVEAQVFIVTHSNDSTGDPDPTPDRESDYLTTMMEGFDHTNDKFTGTRTFKSYAGSTTGKSHDNAKCSPYAVTWHVNTDCNPIKAADLDKFCKLMKDAKLEEDLKPHGSRKVVDQKYVVPDEDVEDA